MCTNFGANIGTFPNLVTILQMLVCGSAKRPETKKLAPLKILYIF